MGLIIDVDGEALDLFEDTSFWITKQIHNLADLTTREADYTKQIAVPNTAKNVRLLQVSDLFDVADAQPVIAVSCNIILDGIPIANNAKLYVDSVEGSELKVAILFGNFNFFDQIQGDIQSIDLSAHAFDYDFQGIVGTQTRFTVQWSDTTVTFPNPHNDEVGDFLVMESQSGLFAAAVIVSVTSTLIVEINLTATGVGPYHATHQAGGDGIAQHTAGAVYPFADWMNILQYSGLDDLAAIKYKQDIEISGFFFYCHTLFEKIVNDAGFTLDRTQITNTMWDELILACPLPIFVLQQSDSQLVQNTKVFQQILSGIGGATDTQRIEFDNTSTVDATLAVWNLGTDAFDWGPTPEAMNAEAVLGDFSLNINGNGFFVTIELHHNAGIIDSVVYDRLSTDTNVTLSGTATALPNDEFYLLVIADGGAGGNGGEITINISPISTITLAKGATSASRTISNPAVWLPEMSKRDFLTGILSMQNVVMQTDDLEKTVTLEYFQDINDNAEQSMTIDVSQDISQTSLAGNYFRNSKFQYKEDSGILRSDTSAIFILEDERLPIDGTVIELPFAACDDSFLYYDRDNKPPPIANVVSYDFDIDSSTGFSWSVGGTGITFEEGTSIDVGDYIGGSQGALQEFRRVVNILTSTTAEVVGTWSTVARTVDGVSTIFRMSEAVNLAKIARVAPMQNAFNVSDGFLFNSVGGGVAGADPQDVTHVGQFILEGFDTVFDSTMLWNDLLAQNYTELLTALKRPMILQLWVYMTVAEFDAISFLRPVYLKDPYNAYFYINVISQFKAGQPVRVDLVRISTT